MLDSHAGTVNESYFIRSVFTQQVNKQDERFSWDDASRDAHHDHGSAEVLYG